MITVATASLLLLFLTIQRVDGVRGSVIRPVLGNAKQEGCRIAAPSTYLLTVGDLVELDYTYPIVPDAIPRKAAYKKLPSGAVEEAASGIRSVHTPALVGSGTIAFYLEAKKVGEQSVTIVIDEAEYEYKFTVEAAK